MHALFWLSPRHTNKKCLTKIHNKRPQKYDISPVTQLAFECSETSYNSFTNGFSYFTSCRLHTNLYDSSPTKMFDFEKEISMKVLENYLSVAKPDHMKMYR